MPAYGISRQRNIDVDQYKYGFVTDIESDKAPKGLSEEADRMLDMGFIHDIRKIVAKLPARRQTLMFFRDHASRHRRTRRAHAARPDQGRGGAGRLDG